MNITARYCSAFNPDASETVAYNNPLFPAYARYGILSTYPDYSAISHWHEDLEFILIRKGKMTYNVNGELIELPENSGIMVNSRQLHYGFSKEHEECEFICILLSPELLKGNEWFYENCMEHITRNAACPYRCLHPEGWEAAVLERLYSLYHSFSGSPTDPLSCFEAMENFIAVMKLLYENLPTETSRPVKESAELSILRTMIGYIEEHLSEHITLEDIASSGAVCKSRCSLLFKKYLNDTPITYTTKLRLKKSLASLLTPGKSITDTAYEYGFCGASYYCETFRKYYGSSPLAYRKIYENA